MLVQRVHTTEQNEERSPENIDYDAFNRLIGRTLDADGSAGTGNIAQTVNIYDGQQIALQFDKTYSNGSASDLSASNLSHRYLWNSQAVDQLFADEKVTSLGTAGSVLWPLTDHENSIRDLAAYDSGTDTTTVANHRVFDAYGNLKSETNSAVDCVFGFTGRLKDEATGLQNNLNRWYDSTTGRWVSEDPIGFSASDANLYRYVGNNPTDWIDPSGLEGYISDAVLAAARQQLRKAGLSEGEINVRMKILTSLADTSGHRMNGNGSCQDWANETILDAYGVEPGDSGYSSKTDKYTNTTTNTRGGCVDTSKCLPGDQIHFTNPYHKPKWKYPESKDDRLENGCNTFVVGKDQRGILLYNRWARWNGSGFVDGTGVMTVDQYRKWIATWDSVKGRYTTPEPNLPIDRVRRILPPK